MARKRHLLNTYELERRKRIRQTRALSVRNMTAPALADISKYTSGEKKLPVCDDEGKMEYCCFSCQALMFQHELHTGTLNQNAKFSTCCNQGKVSLPPLRNPPPALQELWTGRTDQSKHFLRNIRAFNSSLAFTSLGVTEDILPGNGPYVFRISGTVYHRIGGLFPDSNERPLFSQIYIHDSDELQNRLHWNSKLDHDVMRILQTMLHSHNPYVSIFKSAASVITAEANMKLVLRADPLTDPRRYNLPMCSELSIILPATNPMNSQRDIAVYYKNSSAGNHTTKHISETNAQYDPLHYVLLFPHGELGWSIALSKSASVMQFYAYRLMMRSDFNTILRAGRLLHQYVVDQFSKMEQQRLTYVFHNQKELRSELYQGLSDAVHAGDTDGSTVGRKIILPSSFVGGPRHMHQLYQDSMAIVRKFGKPDLFITVTCNPKWPEITKSILPGQDPSDRPDIIARVFHLKFSSILDDIIKKNIFGKVVAYIAVIEFQKRGLPHGHCLFILEEQTKPKSADDYDKFVTAELPPSNLPALRTTISKHMIHGPCGALNPNSPCMTDGICRKKYPKDFVVQTRENSDGYPIYRRRDNDDVVYKNGVAVDNRWIVPYNPYLSMKYDAHINTEICSSISSVKYLYKYIYKGHDRIMMGVCASNRNDEIARYIDSRYVSAAESCWRLFHYDLFHRYPAIQRLAVHLPNRQLVTYNIGEAQDGLDKKSKTTLTAWFDANKTHIDARSYTYADFPEAFTWNSTTSTWTRKCGFSIGRMYTANPAEGERFYLRLLLTNVRGCTSFEDILKLKNGAIASTFKEVAIDRGLFQTDDEWIHCFREAVMTAMPSQLRTLLVILLLFSESDKGGAILSQFFKEMTEDLDETLPRASLFNLLLVIIDDILKSNGKSLSDFPDMPQIDQAITIPKDSDENHYDITEQSLKAQENISKLTSEQKNVLETIIAAIHKSSGGVYFLHGAGGCGKTFLYNTILQKVRSLGLVAVAVASSGIASELLDNGRTAHSQFKIPIPAHPDSTCNISRGSSIASNLKEARLIVWDEAPMLNKNVFECVSRSLSDLRSDDRTFGGVVVLLGGDFRQILPVVRHGSEADIVNSNIKRSSFWTQITHLSLTVNMRIQLAQHEDLHDIERFQNFLLSIGDGTRETYPSIGPCHIQLPETICISDDSDGLQKLIDVVYPTFSNIDYNAAIVCPKNEQVDEINDVIVGSLPQERRTYYSADSVADTEATLYPTEFLNSLTPSGLPPHKLTICKNIPLMLLRNLDRKRGLLNGTRLRVINCHSRVIEVEIMTGKCKGSRVFLPRITLTPSDSGLPFQLKRRQFPVRPAFAMTINKSQGQTFNFIGVDLRHHAFSHGQLYVALSRVGSMDHIRILTSKVSQDEKNFYSPNIVYHTALL